MTTLPKKKETGAVALPGFGKFTREQVELIKTTVAKGTTDDELKLFLYTAEHTGLDPLLKQIHAVKRGGVMAIQTGIDGYRLIADRTKLYAGNDDPIFADYSDVQENGKTISVPGRATVTVYKLVGGHAVGFTATAHWDEYYPGGNQGFHWRKMPHLMLGKCAEALALRKAFPAELASIRTDEEMEQAVVDVKPVSAPTEKKSETKQAGTDVSPDASNSSSEMKSEMTEEPRITETQAKYINSMVERHKIKGFAEYLEKNYKVKTTAEVKLSWYPDIVNWIGEERRRNENA